MNTLLLVEDNDRVRQAVALQLNILYPRSEVTSVPSAAKGIELINSDEPFEMILTDLDNPDKNGGLDVIKALKAQRPGTPVILMTGRCSDEELERLANEHGADAFLPKPFSMIALRETIDRLSAKIPATH